MKHPTRGGLARRIYLAFLVAAVLPTALAGVIGVWASLERLREVTAHGLQQEVSARAAGLRLLFETVAGELRFLATNPQALALLAHQASEPEPRRLELEAILGEQYGRLARSQADIVQIRLLDVWGRERVRVDRNAAGVRLSSADQLQDKSERYYVRETLNRAPGALYVSPLDLNVEQGVVEQPERPVVRLAMAVRDAQGQALGLVVVNLSARVLIEPVQQMVRARDGVAYLFDRSTQFLARRSAGEAEAFEMHPLAQLPQLGPRLRARLLSDTAGYQLHNGSIWAHAPVSFAAGSLAQGAPRWVMAIAFPERVLREQVLDLSRLYLVLLGALGLAAVAGYSLSRHLIKPLEVLAAEVDALAAGDLDRHVQIAGDDEIARLGASFNAMALHLRASLAELQQHRERLEADVQQRTRDLATERAHLAAVLRHASDAIAAVHADGRLLFANQAAAELLAAPDAPQPQPGPAALVGLIGDAQPGRDEVELAGKRWSVCRDRLNAAADLVIVARDVTEERRREEQRRELDRHVAQTDKLATLGELAMGLAHEIGNPLAGMKAVVQTMGLSRHLDTETVEDLRRLEAEIDRLSGFLRVFRVMAAPHPSALTRQVLAVAVEDMLFWVRKAAHGSGVAVRVDIEPTLPPLRADAAQLRQVLLNLFVNALHAMPDGGRLEISASARADQACIEVRDSGHGIDPAALAQVFKPFFSTRTGGSGMGLAVCAKLVADHGGRIAVRSQPGATIFTLWWPLAAADPLPP